MGKDQIETEHQSTLTQILIQLKGIEGNFNTADVVNDRNEKDIRTNEEDIKSLKGLYDRIKTLETAAESDEKNENKNTSNWRWVLTAVLGVVGTIIGIVKALS